MFQVRGLLLAEPWCTTGYSEAYVAAPETPPALDHYARGRTQPALSGAGIGIRALNLLVSLFTKDLVFPLLGALIQA